MCIMGTVHNPVPRKQHRRIEAHANWSKHEMAVASRICSRSAKILIFQVTGIVDASTKALYSDAAYWYFKSSGCKLGWLVLKIGASMMQRAYFLITFFVMALVRISLGEQRQRQLALVASSPFRMIVSPTYFELPPEALQKIEIATANHLLEQSSVYTFSKQQPQVTVKTVEVVIQLAEFQAEFAATRINLFALAMLTVSANDSTNGSSLIETKRQMDLDTLVELAFSTTGKCELFLQRVRESTAASNSSATSAQLLKLNKVVVALLVPAATASTTDGNKGSKKLSTLDVVLIAVSTGIFFGILWLILLHYRELGYFIFDPDRHVLNSNTSGAFPQSQYEEESSDDLEEEFAAATESFVISESRRVSKHRTDTTGEKNVDSNSTTSTPSTTDGAFSPEFSFSVLDGSELQSHVSGMLPSTPSSTQGTIDDAASLAVNESPGLNPSADPFPAPCSSIKSDSSDSLNDIRSLSEPFETNIFRTPTPSMEFRREDFAATESQGIALKSSTGDEVSDSSDDVFQVDVAAAASSATGDSTSRQSASEAIAEWMKTIHVITMAASTSVVTSSTGTGTGHTSLRSLGNASSGKSVLDLTSLDVASLGHVSLEHSMASSQPGADDATPNNDF